MQAAEAIAKGNAMKISPETLSVLKNFSTINKGIVFKAGRQLRTISELHSILAEASVKEEFPAQDVAIYDLNAFLGVVSLFKDPNFIFEETYVEITDGDGKSKVKYRYAADGMVKAPPQKTANKFPDDAITFTLPEENIAILLKAASILDQKEIMVESGENGIVVGIENKKDKSANSYRFSPDGEAKGHTCRLYFKIENLKLLKGSYTVSIYEVAKDKGVGNFRNTNVELQYWVAAEIGSTFK